MNKTLLAVVAGALVGGVAIAGYQNFATPYADVVSSTPLTEKEPIYGDVLAADAVTQVVTGSREVCEQVAVERRQPERFGNKDGAVIGALAGALVGSQVGGGSGRIATSAIGSAVGAIAGQQVYENGQRQRNVGRVTVCDPVPDGRGYGTARGGTGQYDVTYEYGGRTHTTRTNYHPGDRIRVRVIAE